MILFTNARLNGILSSVESLPPFTPSAPSSLAPPHPCPIETTSVSTIHNLLFELLAMSAGLVLGILDGGFGRSTSPLPHSMEIGGGNGRKEMEKLKGWTFPGALSRNGSSESILLLTPSSSTPREIIRSKIKESDNIDSNLTTSTPPPTLSILTTYTMQLSASSYHSRSISFAYARKPSLLLSSPSVTCPKLSLADSLRRRRSAGDVIVFVLFSISLLCFSRALAGKGYISRPSLSPPTSSVVASALSIEDIHPEVYQLLGDTTSDVGVELVLASPEISGGENEHLHHHHGVLGLFKDSIGEEDEEEVLELIGMEDAFLAYSYVVEATEEIERF